MAMKRDNQEDNPSTMDRAEDLSPIKLLRRDTAKPGCTRVTLKERGYEEKISLLILYE